MKRSYAVFPVLLFLLLIIFPACKSGCEIKNRTEGLVMGKFRVFVRIDFPDREKDNVERIILEESGRRAEKLLESYILTDLSAEEGSRALKAKIPEIIKSPEIVCQECNDEYCEAFIDYDGAFGELIK